MKRTFQYSRNTGTSVLRGHIDRHHLLEYLILAEENGWPIWLESIKRVVARGYTLQEIRGVLEDGGTLDSLTSRLPQTSSNTDSSERSSVPSFSLKELHNHLVAFIVADDQVLYSFALFSLELRLLTVNDQSLNVVECKEFRALLLLLRHDLKDSELCHRTQIRDEIISAWKQYFAVLKADLNVRRICCTAFINTPLS